MNLSIGDRISGFVLNKITPINELSSNLYTFEHQQSGARLVYLDTDDDNKVFYAGFKTLPEDSTGVFHILEHSVLCGSRKFPVKEPFVDLLKSSMQTFLNAMTYPDKTVYPCASCNDKDFANLMSVYMDAVFAPNIYTRPQIFKQEGWHVELSDEGIASCKGVVYNEMKGSFSSVDSRNFEAVKQALFPDTLYRHCSGGNPVNIPDLTYDQFIAAHQKYYHPENSFLFLYGSMDLADRLAFLNDEYLCHYTKTGAKIEVPMQAPVCCMDKVAYYPAAESDKAEESAYLTFAAVTGSYADREKNLALSVLFDAIASDNESPLKKKILEQGLGQDFYAYLMDGIAQPYAVFQLRKTDGAKKDEFLKQLTDTLIEYSEQGLDHKQLKATLHRYEFSLREGNTGGQPSGLGYGLTMLDTWLYGGDPAAPLTYEEALAHMNAGLEDGYFENLLKTAIIESNHKAFVTMLPSYTLEKEEIAAETKRFADYKAALSDAEIAALKADNEALVAYQSSEDSPEAQATIPMLSLSDIQKDGKVYPTEEAQTSLCKLLIHPLDTKKIAYLNFYFDLSSLTKEELPYAKLLTSLLGNLSTKRHSAADLRCAIDLKLGELSCFTSIYGEAGQTDHCYPKLVVRASVLDHEIPDALELVHEVITETIFEKAEIGKIILQERNNKRMNIIGSGNSFGIAELRGSLSAAGAVNAAFNGLAYYRKLCSWSENFENAYPEFTAQLSALMNKIFTSTNLTVSYTGASEAADSLKSALNSFELPDGKAPVPYRIALNPIRSFGISVPSGVCYAVQCTDFLAAANYSGSMAVMSKILTLDYLWNEVRVKGGAYGTHFGADASGHFVMSSYRDPAVAPTLARYAGIPDYLRGFAKNGDATKYIISTMSDVDHPFSAKQMGSVADNHYFCKTTPEWRAKVRAEILSTTASDLVQYADLLEKLLPAAPVCAIGNREKLTEALNDIEEL